MKQITGNDKISARALYGEPVEFKPQFKIALMCNDLPKMMGTDNGTWRRINVTPFISTFKEEPNNNNSEAPEFPIDKQLADHFEEWKTAFMHILLEKYKEYDRYIKDGGGNPAPPIITSATDKYKAREDIVTNFINENIRVDQSPGNMIKISGGNGIYSAFRDWCKEQGIMVKDIIKCPDFTDNFEKNKEMKNVRIGSSNKYRVRFKEDEDDKDEDKTKEENKEKFKSTPEIEKIINSISLSTSV